MNRSALTPVFREDGLATVKSHLVHIFTTLGVISRTLAVVKARELGLIRS